MMKTFKLDSDDKILEQIWQIRHRLMRAFESVTSPYFTVLLNRPQTYWMIMQPDLVDPGSNTDGPWRFAGADIYPVWNWPAGIEGNAQGNSGK